MYEDLAAVMKAGLIKMNVKEGRGGHSWFTHDIADLRKARHGQRENG